MDEALASSTFDLSHCLKCLAEFYYERGRESFELCQACLSDYYERNQKLEVRVDALEHELAEVRFERDELQEHLDEAEDELRELKETRDPEEVVSGVASCIRALEAKVDDVQRKMSGALDAMIAEARDKLEALLPPESESDDGQQARTGSDSGDAGGRSTEGGDQVSGPTDTGD